MANVYYSDNSGTNLNVFEKKTKGGEPFYYIYLNKTKITEGDVGKLTKVMQDVLPQATIKTKKGKIAYQITWSYNSPTPLMSETKLFGAIFSYLKGYGYVDNYQGKGTKSAKSTNTQVNDKGVPLLNIANPSVIKKGDLFYIYLKSTPPSLESPCLITDYDPNTSIFDFTRYVKEGQPQYEHIEEWRLREMINQNEAFLCKITDGGYFINHENTFSIDLEPIKADDSFEMMIYENGGARKGGLPNEEQVAMFICASRLMPKIKPTQQATQTQAPTKKGIKPLNFDDLFRTTNNGKLYSLESTDSGSLDVNDDEAIELNYLNRNAMDSLSIIYEDLLKRIDDGQMEYLGKVREGDVFVADIKDKFVVTKVEGNVITYEIIDINANKSYGLNSLPLSAFVNTIQSLNCKLESRANSTQTTTISNTVFSNQMTLEPNDIFWMTNNQFDILRIKEVDVKNDFVTAEWFNSGNRKYTTSTYGYNTILDEVRKGEFQLKKLEVGDEFETRLGDKKFTITDIIDFGGGDRAITYEFNGKLEKLSEMPFIVVVQGDEMCWARNNVATLTSPMQVGDKFIICVEPYKPTKEESENLREVVSIDLKNQDLDYQNKKGDVNTLPFDEIRKFMDEGYIIVHSVNRPNQSATTPLVPTSLRYYDLISKTSNGKLYRVVNVIGLMDTFDVFNNITDVDQISLEEYDENARDFIITYPTFLDLKTNLSLGNYKYLGQVREGDSFINHSNNLERFVTKVDSNNDVQFKISDLNFTPPRIVGNDNLVMNVFTKGLLQQSYKFNLRLGDTSNTPKPTPQSATSVTPKPQISNSEINALKKELADLIFLKSGISDLDFEDKINISTEIYDVQKKIDDLNVKLFEQSVGDEQFFDKLFEQSFTPLKDRYDLVITENNLNELLSPSGEISDLNEDLQVIVNSKEFKEWFGDWRNAFFYRNLPDFGGLNISKVLNNKFEPQLVWHGTNNEFSYFDFEMFPANYFAVNKEYSEFFATNKGGRGYVLPFFLDIKNPLDLSEFGNDFVSTKDFFDWMFLMTGMSPEELEINPIFLDPNVPPNPIWMYIRNNATMLKKIAQGRVYDGIKFYEFNPNEKDNPDTRAYETLAYIIFDPHQAKLADPSRGEILLASLKSFMLKRGGKI